MSNFQSFLYETFVARYYIKNTPTTDNREPTTRRMDELITNSDRINTITALDSLSERHERHQTAYNRTRPQSISSSHLAHAAGTDAPSCSFLLSSAVFPADGSRPNQSHDCQVYIQQAHNVHPRGAIHVSLPWRNLRNLA